jgi:hypothetical protein
MSLSGISGFHSPCWHGVAEEVKSTFCAMTLNEAKYGMCVTNCAEPMALHGRELGGIL